MSSVMMGQPWLWSEDASDDTRYRLAFEHCSDAMILLDPVSDRVTDANRAAQRLLGYSREELRRLPVTDLHPSQRPGLAVFTQSVIERGSDWTNAMECRRKDGSVFKPEYSASVVNESGRVCVLAVLRDPAELERHQARAEAETYIRRGISEWRRIEHLFRDIERENQLILRAAGEGIYGVNAEGKTTFANPAAERILGWSAEELVGRDMHSLVHHTKGDGSPYPDYECPIYAAFRDGTVHRVDDEVFWRKDGSPIVVEYTSTPIRDRGVLVGAVIVFRDVTRRKQAEERLHAALEELNTLKQRLELENAYLQEEIRTEYNHWEIIGRSQAVQKVLHQIEVVAPTDVSVLVHGESGTGKELIARAIHEASSRSDRPLIRVNCAAVPRELFESEFFGHVRGAFTGALRDRVGRFELADGGTLFLDEISEMPLELQGKLLRVIQEGQFERLGEEHTRKVDVRLIAATNRDLAHEVKEGRFREDLYFRLNVFPIESVPLRERVEDIAMLASHFLQRVGKRLNLPDLRLTHGDIRRLSAYSWPGNVRELENVIERAAILARGGRLALDLPATEPEHPRVSIPMSQATPGGDSAVVTDEERRRRDRQNLVEALRACNGKVFGPGGAAELLGVKPTTLASRIKSLGIDRRGFAPRA
jgi:PAS domain S-box-containing protein